MSYFYALSRCVSCGRVFQYNPNRVPSLEVEGTRKPVCQTCVDRINPVRKAAGLDEIVPLPGAYEPARDEEDISFSGEGE